MYKVLLLSILTTLTAVDINCFGEETSFIIDGVDSEQHEFPSVASLKLESKHLCGATLISKNSILTAAHCVYKMRNMNSRDLHHKKLVAVLGEHDLQIHNSKELVISIQRIIVAPGYKEATDEDDIAVLYLTRNIAERDHISIATLPTQNMEIGRPGMHCTILGWGSPHKHGFLTKNILQKAEDMEIISSSDCLKRYPNFRGDMDKNVCVVDNHGSKGICNGDSGSPLFCNIGNKMTLIGVASFGPRMCGTRKMPSVFVRVSKFRDWINQNL